MTRSSMRTPLARSSPGRHRPGSNSRSRANRRATSKARTRRFWKRSTATTRTGEHGSLQPASRRSSAASKRRSKASTRLGVSTRGRRSSRPASPPPQLLGRTGREEIYRILTDAQEKISIRLLCCAPEAGASTPPPSGRTPSSGPLSRSALLFGVAAWAPARADARIVKRLDYESGSLGQWSYVQALPGRISVVKSPRRQGQYAARFVVKPGDDHRWLERANAPRSYTLNRGACRHRFVVEMGYLLPSRLPSGEGRLECLHSMASHRSLMLPAPETSMSTRGLALGESGWSFGAAHSSRIAPRAPRRLSGSHGLRREHWYSFKLHVRWSPYSNKGLVKLWVNGRLRASKHLATLYKGQGVYVKQGFYRAPSSRTSVIYHDGLQRFGPEIGRHLLKG